MIDEAAAIYERLGAAGNLARLMWVRGAAYAAAGRRDDALAEWTRAYEASIEAGDLAYATLAASSLATSRLDAGDRPGAARWFITALREGRKMADVTGMILALPVAAMAAIELVGPGTRSRDHGCLPEPVEAVRRHAAARPRQGRRAGRPARAIDGRRWTPSGSRPRSRSGGRCRPRN